MQGFSSTIESIPATVRDLIDRRSCKLCLALKSIYAQLVLIYTGSSHNLKLNIMKISTNHSVIIIAFFQFLLVPRFSVAQSPAEKLSAHGIEFQKEVIEVTNGVYVAIGFALANSIMIEGDDGVIIVDVTGSPAAAEEVNAAFAEITNKPIEAIIYTHSHPDHTGGAKAFAKDGNTEIYAHELVNRSVSNDIQQILNVRAVRQFGLSLPSEKFLNAGIGPWMKLDWSGFLKPTKTIADRLEVEIAGIQVVLQYAPGETEDQLYVWLPGKKLLMPGDNYYKAFPNLYTIRGSTYRDIQLWAQSLDKMLNEGEIEFLVPSHTRPVIGVTQVKNALTNYRDAIRFVYDESVKGINAGMNPIELSQQVRLPEHLANDPALQEFYGTVPWSVRSVYSGLIGWFDGNATNLFPLSSKERAERLAKLAGGADRIRENAIRALNEGDPQWAAELTDHLMALDENDKEAMMIKAKALTILGENQTSSNGRNYYLTQAQELFEKSK